MLVDALLLGDFKFYSAVPPALMRPVRVIFVPLESTEAGLDCFSYFGLPDYIYLLCFCLGESSFNFKFF